MAAPGLLGPELVITTYRNLLEDFFLNPKCIKCFLLLNTITPQAFERHYRLQSIQIQGVAAGLIQGWVDLDLDVPPFCPSGQAELDRPWNDLNQCQPNPVSDHQPHPVNYL